MLIFHIPDTTLSFECLSSQSFGSRVVRSRHVHVSPIRTWFTPSHQISDGSSLSGKTSKITGGFQTQVWSKYTTFEKLSGVEFPETPRPPTGSATENTVKSSISAPLVLEETAILGMSLVFRKYTFSLIPELVFWKKYIGF